MGRAGRGITLAAAGALAAVVISAPIASADALKGKTYAEARERVAQWNSVAEIATVVGNQLPLDECIVTSWTKSTRMDAALSVPDSRGRYGWPDQQIRHSVHLLHLDCNEALARPGNPGSSMATSRGRQEAFLRNREEYFRDHPDKTAQLQAFCSRHPKRSVCLGE